jgi:hypothetical protein
MFSDVVGYTAIMGRDEHKGSGPSATIASACDPSFNGSTGD